MYREAEPMQAARNPTPANTPRGPTWLGDENRFWLLFTVILAFIAALKGLRIPGEWPLTESLIDYSHGFVKRGLLGTILGAVGIFERRPLSLSYFAELFLLLALLAVFTHRSGLVQRAGLVLPAALFAGSYAVTYLFHIIGYSDIVNALLVLALLLIRNARRRFLLALLLVPAALLIHEAFLLLFAPLLLLSFYLQGLAASGAERHRVWRLGLLLALVAGVVTLVVALQPTIAPDKVDAFADYVWNRADFVIREDFFQVYLVTLADNFRNTFHFGWEQYLWWTNQAVSLCVLGPALLLLLHFSRRLLHARLSPPATPSEFHSSLTPHSSSDIHRYRWAAGAVLVSILSPLTLHFLALDGVRWNVWVVVDAFLALCLLAMHLPGDRLTITLAERNAVLLAIALGMAGGYGLFNNVQVNPYPFFPKLLQNLIKRHDTRPNGFRDDVTSRLSPPRPPSGTRPGT